MTTRLPCGAWLAVREEVGRERDGAAAAGQLGRSLGRGEGNAAGPRPERGEEELGLRPEQRGERFSLFFIYTF